MTEIANPTHIGRWKSQAQKIAEELKAVPSWNQDKPKLKVGIVFDDAIITVTIDVSMIQKLSVNALADSLFTAALEAVLGKQGQVPPDRKAGDGIGEAAETRQGEPDSPLGDERKARPTSGDGPRQAGCDARENTGTSPAPAEVQPLAPLGKCWRRIEPDYVQPCQNDATGGVRLVLYPARSVQLRYGRKPLLRLILDLQVCPECFAKMTPHQVISDGLAPGQWGAISKVTQQRNNGWLPIKENSVIDHVPAGDPEYVALRAQIAKAAANDSAGSSPAPGAS